MKWFSAILEGIVGFVMWSFVGFWMGLIPAGLLQVSTNLQVSTRTARIIGVSAAAVLGFIMAVVYARQDPMTLSLAGSVSEMVFSGSWSSRSTRWHGPA